jgi:predicted PP-loop superfamily ATPase
LIESLKKTVQAKQKENNKPPSSETAKLRYDCRLSIKVSKSSEEVSRAEIKRLKEQRAAMLEENKAS